MSPVFITPLSVAFCFNLLFLLCGSFSDQSPLTTSPLFPSKASPPYLEEEEDGTGTNDAGKLGNLAASRPNRPREVRLRIL